MEALESRAAGIGPEAGDPRRSEEIRGDPRRSEQIRGQNYGISVHFLQAAAARAELLTLRHLAKTTKKCPKCRAPRNVCKKQRQNLKVK